MNPLSANSQAILLLTAPLIVGRSRPSEELLTPSEYNKLARVLREHQQQPSDLLGSEGASLVERHLSGLGSDRLNRLLKRGFLLSQAIERWRSRTIWVISRADPEYPKRLKTRLQEACPPVLYGCGDASILDTGGLAVVGSRNAGADILEYSEQAGVVAARAKQTVISGGARGVDQAAMNGALHAGGRVAGVLADGLERAALAREYREALMERSLVLVSPYDPGAGFNVGNAMQRNKVIYALADAALIVSSDFEKGGTWAGAVEQLDKLRLIPIYVRANGGASKGIEALVKKGALAWSNPEDGGELIQLMSAPPPPDPKTIQQGLMLTAKEIPATDPDSAPKGHEDLAAVTFTASPADSLMARVRELLQEHLETPSTEGEVAELLQVSRAQAATWLKQLVKEGVIDRTAKPLRYRSAKFVKRLL